MDGHPVTEAVQPPPKKEGKSAVILLQETEGGMNIMVSFQNGNNQSAPSEFDPASYLHQLANAAPKLFMGLAKDFEDAVSGVAPVADDQGGDVHCDSFDEWWRRECSAGRISNGDNWLDRVNLGDDWVLARKVWEASRKSLDASRSPPSFDSSTRLAELQRAAGNDGFFDWWRRNGDAWQAESKDLDPWIMAHQVWQSAIKSRAPSEEAPRFPGVDIDAAHKEKENTQPAPIAEFKEGEFWKSPDGYVYAINEVEQGQNKDDYVRICLTNGYSYLRLRSDNAGWCQVDRPTIDLVHNAEQAATLNPQLTVQSPVKWSDLPQSERDACMNRVRDREAMNRSNAADNEPRPLSEVAEDRFGCAYEMEYPLIATQDMINQPDILAPLTSRHGDTTSQPIES